MTRGDTRRNNGDGFDPDIPKVHSQAVPVELSITNSTTANYPASSTFDERNQIGPALPRMAQYTGAQMDIDEYDDGRRPYNTGQPGYPSGIGRQGSLPVSSTYSPDPSFPAYHIQRIPGLYDSNSDPRTTTNTTLPPVSMPVSMSGQSPFGGYSVQPTAQGRYHDI